MDNYAADPDNKKSAETPISAEKEEETVTGTVKIYSTTSKTGAMKAQINIKGNVAPHVKELYGQGEELLITINKSNREINIQPLTNIIKK